MAYCRDCEQYFSDQLEECPLCGGGLVEDWQSPDFEPEPLKVVKEFPNYSPEVEVFLSFLRSFGIEPQINRFRAGGSSIPVQIFVRENDYQKAMEIIESEINPGNGFQTEEDEPAEEDGFRKQFIVVVLLLTLLFIFLKIMGII